MADSPLAEGIGLVKIDHVGIAVPELDKAIRFYTDVFGLRCVHQETNEEQGVREAMMAAGEDSQGTMIQLLAPTDPESVIARFLDRQGPGMQQLAFTVTDIARASAVLRGRGLRLVYDA